MRALLLLLLFTMPALAAIEEHRFDSAEQQARYDALIFEMRCPMCLNANLAGSDAPIAADLRQEIYEQIQAGRSDAEIMAFMKARYGDFITYRPPLNRGTALLWFGPLVLLIAGFFIVRRMLAASRTAAVEELNADEQARLRKLLADEERTRS